MVALMVCSLLAAGQPPADPPNGKEFQRYEIVWNADKPDDLQAALANHPDVQIAEIKLRLAQAELAKAKQVAAQAITAARGKLEGAKAGLEAAQKNARRARDTAAAGENTKSHAEEAEAAAVAAKAAVATAEGELQMVMGIAPGSRFEFMDITFNTSPSWQYRHLPLSNTLPAVPAGLVTDKLRELLDKPVKLGEFSNVPFQQVLDTFRVAAGTDLIFRSNLPAESGGKAGVVSFAAAERPVRAWIDLISDEYRRSPVAAGVAGGFDVFVREYGLVWQYVSVAPPGSMPLSEFLRQPKPPTK